MPTMNEVIGNLGQPLAYGEYRLDDTSTEEMTAVETHAEKVNSPGDVEGTADVEILVLDSTGMEQVCACGVHIYAAIL